MVYVSFLLRKYDKSDAYILLISWYEINKREQKLP